MNKDQLQDIKEYVDLFSSHLDRDDLNGFLNSVQNFYDNGYFELLIEQAERYHDFIKTVSDPWEVARKINKETGKDLIPAEEIVRWIEREAEGILERESDV